jgi:hypothetical protein
MDPQSKPNATTLSTMHQLILRKTTQKTAKELFNTLNSKSKEVTEKKVRGELNEDQRKAALGFLKRMGIKTTEFAEKINELKRQGIEQVLKAKNTSLELEEVEKQSGTMGMEKKMQLSAEFMHAEKEHQKNLEDAH